MSLLRLLLEGAVPRFVGYSIGFVLVSGLAGPMAFAAETAIDRTILPIKEPARQTYSELDARNATPPPRFQIKAPKGAPNVLVILIDDMGFGVSSAFGGPARMPTADRLAEQGLRYNNFHTTALCAPTRTALLSGRNHHVNNMGSITETATAFPGNTGQRPDNVAYISEILRYNGYSTACMLSTHRVTPRRMGIDGIRERVAAARLRQCPRK
jgi:arylsulfatase